MLEQGQRARLPKNTPHDVYSLQTQPAETVHLDAALEGFKVLPASERTRKLVGSSEHGYCGLECPYQTMPASGGLHAKMMQNERTLHGTLSTCSTSQPWKP